MTDRTEPTMFPNPSPVPSVKDDPEVKVIDMPEPEPHRALACCTCTGPARDAHDSTCPVRMRHPRQDLGDGPIEPDRALRGMLTVLHLNGSLGKSAYDDAMGLVGALVNLPTQPVVTFGSGGVCPALSVVYGALETLPKESQERVLKAVRVLLGLPVEGNTIGMASR